MPGFEAIFVNDGSRDSGTFALCKSAALEDTRFRIIDQPNKGVAKARNAALDAARGEYICFLDPDDWVEPDMAQVLSGACKKTHCRNIRIYNDYYDESGDFVKTLIDSFRRFAGSRGKPFQEHFDALASSYLVITKMLRRACIEAAHLRFPERTLGEDGLFYVAFMRQNPSCLVAIQKPLYHYTVARSASLSNSWHPEQLRDNA